MESHASPSGSHIAKVAKVALPCPMLRFSQKSGNTHPCPPHSTMSAQIIQHCPFYHIISNLTLEGRATMAACACAEAQ
eukprot:1161972-Pelagomonas_calceolata.AAC.12